MHDLVEIGPALDGIVPAGVQSIGLNLPPGLAIDKWRAIGETLRSIERNVMWWIGDWLRYGERTYGETYTQALETTDYSYQTLRTATYVSGRFELFRRRNNLSFAHHLEVAALEPDAQDELLDAAAAHGWSRNDLRGEVNRLKNRIGANPQGDTCTVADLQTLVGNGARYGTIYADPPWQYGNQGTRAATGNHYGGMTVDEIAELPINALASVDAHLHLWTTNAFLFDAPRIMAAWGFEYKSCFVWVKPSIGIGNYWRVSHEYLLFGVKGSAPFYDRSLISWGEYERGSHSAKPEQIRALIERASPSPRLELFARSVAEGWTVWGDGIERNLMHGLARVVA
jgi:N6-adenosine-specific RNA methylase IME4